MSFVYTVLGAGRQGVAMAYDLLRNGEAGRVVLADADEHIAEAAVERLRKLCPDSAAEIRAVRCDVAQRKDVLAAMDGAHVVASAVPYRFNASLADTAIEAHASFCDLGGNTDVVRSELALDARAAAAGVSIVPDCGLAPGLSNHLAAHGVATLEHPEHVRVFCGGLPERPVGPLGYKLVFNFEGLANEYSGYGEYLRDGKRVDVQALSEQETVDFGAPVGALEAAVTSGGTSTCPQTWLGRLTTYEYKTVRYPGHWAIIRALFGLGAFEPRLALRGGRVIEPRALTRALFEEHLTFPDVPDVVVLRVLVSGRHGGASKTLQYDLFERFDPHTGFTAMERGTAFPAALVASMQARGLVAAGAKPLEVSVPAVRYFEELGAHDIEVRLTVR